LDVFYGRTFGQPLFRSLLLNRPQTTSVGWAGEVEYRVSQVFSRFRPLFLVLVVTVKCALKGLVEVFSDVLTSGLLGTAHVV
jgi:hypothetical protein